jgi:hypothetical protein
MFGILLRIDSEATKLNKREYVMSVKSVVVMAGGTGGHVFPALAVAQHLATKA